MPDIEDRAHVGVREGGDRARLAFETLPALGIGRAIVGKDFDRDDAVETGVAGAVDFAHPAFA